MRVFTTCLCICFFTTLLSSANAPAVPVATGEFGTISEVVAQKAITFVPWGKTVAEAKSVGSNPKK